MLIIPQNIYHSCVIASINTAIGMFYAKSPQSVAGSVEVEWFSEQLSEPCAIVYLSLAW